MQVRVFSSGRDRLSRRDFVAGGAIMLTSAGCLRTCPANEAAKVAETKTISQEPDHYHGWPTLARRGNGQLVLVYSGGREGHVCPFGRVEMMVSNDEGRSWGFPQVLLDTALDDRDSGVLETARGSLLVTTFTSLAYEPLLERALKPSSGESWPPERLRRWQSARDRLTPEQRRSQLGEWMLRSTDGGITWSRRYSSIVNSPHGPVQLADGRLLYAGKELWSGEKRVGVCESKDDGQTWSWLAAIPPRPGDRADAYHELHAERDRGRANHRPHPQPQPDKRS